MMFSGVEAGEVKVRRKKDWEIQGRMRVMNALWHQMLGVWSGGLARGEMPVGNGDLLEDHGVMWLSTRVGGFEGRVTAEQY